MPISQFKAINEGYRMTLLPRNQNSKKALTRREKMLLISGGAVILLVVAFVFGRSHFLKPKYKDSPNTAARVCVMHATFAANAFFTDYPYDTLTMEKLLEYGMSWALNELPEELRLTIVNGKQECLIIECEHEKGTEVLYIDSDTAIHSRPRNRKTKNIEVRHPFDNCLEIQEVRHPIDNSLMVYIQAGKFSMGSDMYTTEQPIQKIYLDGYYIDMFPVTIEQFERFISETGHITDAEKNGGGMVLYSRSWVKVPEATWKMPDGLSTMEEKNKHPVSQVSYNDALAYCRWANKDLPTEAQWEKAARGPDGKTYPWGDMGLDDTFANFGNTIGATTPVDRFEKGRSHYGLWDMAGNLYEW